MQLNELLQRLKGVKGNGKQYKALCPAHDDKTPSLSIGESDGKILLHCHVGCATENILGALGLEMKDLLLTKPEYKPKKEIAAVYDYKDLDGNIIHSTIRYNPKGFAQRRPDPQSHGEYIWRDVFKSITPIIYNLAAVTTAIKEKQPVLLVEGEKDCDNLNKYGFVATTSPMGAGKWRDSFSTFLKGGAIYIIPDNDEAGYSHFEKVVKSLVGKAEAVYLVDLPTAMPNIPTGGDISDFIEATPAEERQSAIEGLLANATLYEADSKETSQGNGKKSQAEQLLELVEQTGATFFHSDIKDLYSAIPVREHMEVLPIMGRDFEIWLNGQFYNASGKPISKDAIKQTIGVLSAKALYDNPDPVKLSTRAADRDGTFWYDLTNTDWQAVKITTEGWEVENSPPILFHRYRHQIQQTLPKKGGNIRKMLDYVTIKGNETLFLCWLVSCFVPNIPHAIMILHGEKGAAKSTTSTMLKSLIDPSALDTLTLQNDQRTLAVNLQNHWFLPFDNVSFVNEETSDTLCRAVTGGGIQQRKLHTNAEDMIFTFQRCVAINGIHNVATRADLLDRSILIELMRIKDSNRRELSEVMANFEVDKPDILGGIFDTLVKAMNIYPTLKLKNLPRMADFARWGYAIGEALGEGTGQIFLDEYTANRQIQNEEAIANDPVATLIVEFMKGRDSWYGLYSELYKKLENIADDHGISAKHKSFPANAIGLSKRITAIKSNLETVGINCKPEKRTNGGQNLSIKRANPSTLSTSSTQASNNEGLSGVDKSVDGTGGGLSTPLSTLDKAHDSRVCVDRADGVDKNVSFEDWCTVDETITDEDLPEGFL